MRETWWEFIRNKEGTVAEILLVHCLLNNFLFYCIPLFMIILLNIDTNGVKKYKTTFEGNHGCTIRFEFIE